MRSPVVCLVIYVRKDHNNKYKVYVADQRNELPSDAEVITSVDKSDKFVMMEYVKNKLAEGWSPDMCRQACDDE